MKKVFCIGVCIFLAGCTSYLTKMDVDPISSPDCTTQILRNEPLLSSAKNAVFFNKRNIADLKKYMEQYKDDTELPYLFLVSKDNEKLSIQTSTLNNFLKHSTALFDGKIFVDIQDCQSAMGQINGGLVSVGVSAITTEGNLQYDLKRLNLLSGLISDELAVNGFKTARIIEEADYKMKILVIEDGITAKSTLGVFYSKSKKAGIIGMDIKIIDLKTNEVVLAYRTKNSAYLSKLSILYCIPKYHSSENLEMEY